MNIFFPSDQQSCRFLLQEHFTYSNKNVCREMRIDTTSDSKVKPLQRTVLWFLETLQFLDEKVNQL